MTRDLHIQQAQPAEPVSFSIRPVDKQDVPYIMATWLRALRNQPDPLPDDLFFAAYRPLAIRLLRSSQTRVAVDPEGKILGFSVTWDSDGVLHWVYVRERKRGRGIGLALISHLPARPPFTLRTWSAKTTFRAHLGQYKPSLLHNLKDTPQT